MQGPAPQTQGVPSPVKDPTHLGPSSFPFLQSCVPSLCSSPLRADCGDCSPCDGRTACCCPRHTAPRREAVTALHVGVTFDVRTHNRPPASTEISRRGPRGYRNTHTYMHPSFGRGGSSTRVMKMFNKVDTAPTGT